MFYYLHLSDEKWRHGEAGFPESAQATSDFQTQDWLTSKPGLLTI